MPTNKMKDHNFPGFEAASHAEKQLHWLGSRNMGVSNEMCSGCVKYFTLVAGYKGENIYITDPSNAHIFTYMGLHFSLH